jgi:Flp pilus assembly protein TadD
MAALADVYERAGRPQDAANQRELIEVVDRIYRANGISTDLQLSLFFSDHGLQPERALQMAQSAFEGAPGVYAADALAWALYRSGQFGEASKLSNEAQRFRTPEALFYYHAGLIEAALGNRGVAVERLETALRLNPYFSARQAPEAKSLLDQLKGTR